MLPEYSSKLFDYSADRNTFYTDLSLLDRSNIGSSETFGRIYNDAADVGFRMVSHRTGDTADFYLSEQDEEAMVFLPMLETITKNPRLRTARIVVFNT